MYFGITSTCVSSYVNKYTVFLFLSTSCCKFQGQQSNASEKTQNAQEELLCFSAWYGVSTETFSYRYFHFIFTFKKGKLIGRGSFIPTLCPFMLCVQF